MLRVSTRHSTPRRSRMKIHANAPLGPKGRALMVRRVVAEGWTIKQAAKAAGVSERTCGKWVARWRAEGPAGLIDRSSEPNTVANRTAAERTCAMAALRRLRVTGTESAECRRMAPSTVAGILTRVGLGRLCAREAPAPANRSERAGIGELIRDAVTRIGG